MIRVTVELVPGGARRPKKIASMQIANISDLTDVSDYTVLAADGGCDALGIPALIENFKIRGHNRRQTVWALIAKAAHHLTHRD